MVSFRVDEDDFVRLDALARHVRRQKISDKRARL
jgi:predicted transcriptional regulator